MKILTDMRLLKGMRKHGLIEFAEDTGYIVRHLIGRKVKACYIQDGPWEFEYKYRRYGVRYFDGRFKPFVVELDTLHWR